MHDTIGPETRRDTPQAAACEFRSILGVSGSVQGQSGASDPDIISQLRGLEKWAAARGELTGGEWLTTAKRGGAEHFIQHAQDSVRVTKITYPSQFEKFMAGNGFRKLGDENAYFREVDHLAVFDAHARNFVLTDDVPVPFDVLRQRVSERLQALLSLW